MGGIIMVEVTLVGKCQAVVGHEFIYCGSISDCRDCKLKTACFNLEQGRLYKIKNLRKKEHRCKMYERGVEVVEVEKIPMKIIVDSRSGLEGATLNYQEQKCTNKGCEFYLQCHPNNIKQDTKIIIKSVNKDNKIKCDEKYSLVQVEVEL